MYVLCHVIWNVINNNNEYDYDYAEILLNFIFFSSI